MAASRVRTRPPEQLRRLEATREDLLATISHEFRTPLTAIQGAALTLRKHGDRLDRPEPTAILDAVIANAERLGRLLENMLTAAEARSPDEQAVADVHRIATEVIATVEAAHPQRTEAIVVAIAAGLWRPGSSRRPCTRSCPTCSRTP